jgi:hypothetical protein
MADRELSVMDDLQDISDSLEKAIKEAADDDRIVLSKAQAETMLQSFNELWDEAIQHEESAKARKPMFLHVAKPSEIYLQPSAVAMVFFDAGGNAVLSMVNGVPVAIEGLQWQRIKKHFHAGVELVEVESTGGIVGSSGLVKS